MVRKLAVRAYDLAALMDSDVATALRSSGAAWWALRAAQQWGIVVKENQVQAYAWKNGIAASGKELTEQQKVLARYGLIMEQVPAGPRAMER
jgi:hypothetical protein